MRPSLYAQNINTSRIYKLLVEVVVFDNVNKAYVDMCTGQLWIQNQSCFKIWNSILPSESNKKNKKETKNNASCGIFFPAVFKNVNTRVSNLFSIFKDMLHELQRVKFPSFNLCLLSS